MFDILKKIFSEKQPYNYKVDIHSHLIPAIDDGSKSMNDSIDLIKGLHSLGFQKIITTPHTMSHRFPNSKETILEGYKQLQAELKIQNIDIVLEVASEYYLDEHFLELLERRELLTFGENYLLFEHCYGIKPLNYENNIFEMKVSGYQPVLAHPERYLFMHKDFKMYERLKEQGVLFQLNLNSLGGYYSKEVAKVASKLVDAGFIDFLGSDTHHQKHLTHLKQNLNFKQIERIFLKNNILNEQLL